MPKAAPRYDPRILTAARALDDRRLPIAETCRRVAALAEVAGLTRPSYVHLRRFVRAERLRRHELDQLLEEVVEGVLRRRPVDLAELADQLRDIDGRRRLRVRS